MSRRPLFARLQWVGVAALLLLWQAVFSLRLWPDYLLPSPAAVAQTLWRLTLSGALPAGLLTTLGRLAVGYLVAAVAGLAAGLVLARSDRLSEVFGPVVLGFQALPSICWFPLAILWVGLNEGAILFVTVVGTLFAVISSTESAIRNLPPTYVRAGVTMGAKGWRLYTGVILPAALPQILTGLRVGWSFSWRSLMSAELLFMNQGLGNLLSTGRELADAAQVLAIILVILAVGLAIDRAVFACWERRLRRRWGYERAA